MHYGCTTPPQRTHQCYWAIERWTSSEILLIASTLFAMKPGIYLNRTSSLLGIRRVLLEGYLSVVQQHYLAFRGRYASTTAPRCFACALDFLYSSALCEICPNAEFIWSVFSRIRTEYGEIWSISPYLSVFSPNAGKYRPEKTL